MLRAAPQRTKGGSGEYADRGQSQSPARLSRAWLSGDQHRTASDGVAAPRWLPDTRHLVFVRDGRVWLLDTTGPGEAVPVAGRVGRRQGAPTASTHEPADLSPDLMTLDLRMPGMGGAEAIPLLRACAPRMRVVVYSSQLEGVDLSGGSRPDAAVLKGANLGDLIAVIQRLLSEGPKDLVKVDLGRLAVTVAVDAFDSWVGLNARVREALATKGDSSYQLLGDVPVDSAELLCLMGVFMQFGMPLMVATSS